MDKPIWTSAGGLTKVIAITMITMITMAMSACSFSPTGGSSGSAQDTLAEVRTQIEADSRAGSSQRGLELRLLTVDDAGDRVAHALSRFAGGPGVMGQEDTERWNSWGLRWIVVPADELDSVLGSLKFTQASKVRSMGEFPQWRPMIRTGQIRNGVVRVGGSTPERLQELNGRPRLLARLWAVPELTESGARAKLHLDLAVQMTQEKQSNRWDTLVLPKVIDEGKIIEELRMTLLLDSSRALVLVGEDPQIQWVYEEGTGTVTISQTPEDSLGPSTPRARTLGQQMLSTPGTGYVAPGQRYVAPKKVLIVLVPKVGGSYRLLGSGNPIQQEVAP